MRPGLEERLASLEQAAGLSATRIVWSDDPNDEAIVAATSAAEQADPFARTLLVAWLPAEAGEPHMHPHPFAAREEPKPTPQPAKATDGTGFTPYVVDDLHEIWPL
jgi:hypothetical protein